MNLNHFTNKIDKPKPNKLFLGRIKTHRTDMWNNGRVNLTDQNDKKLWWKVEQCKREWGTYRYILYTLLIENCSLIYILLPLKNQYWLWLKLDNFLKLKTLLFFFFILDLYLLYKQFTFYDSKKIPF